MSVLPYEDGVPLAHRSREELGQSLVQVPRPGEGLGGIPAVGAQLRLGQLAVVGVLGEPVVGDPA
ncbi:MULTISPECIES: hypothetical protein [unclassified Streptomyces]|uniref:hypothetical protein n=1 Tax=unclassified Streptomyces TaxID=2593676 RepID=UPI001BEAC861|nr:MULTISPECIES: hypothetical protein [unclassified Streptomyces]MBT2406542.1 hypothetical protein [Streptomyces sp. ISL-21]MBT2459809.1 hypothetical protein [Streptomyces sp. ISL-86]MBT2608880.1 hypothetical protein [Streptomyces sp. ISL-87]